MPKKPPTHTHVAVVTLTIPLDPAYATAQPEQSTVPMLDRIQNAALDGLRHRDWIDTATPIQTSVEIVKVGT